MLTQIKMEDMEVENTTFYVILGLGIKVGGALDKHRQNMLYWGYSSQSEIYSL
jgi:hypothetical protein